MPLINSPSPGEKLRRNYNLNQPYSGALAEEVVPVVLVDDFSESIYRGGDAAAGTGKSQAVAGARSLVLFAMPQTSSRRAILSRFWVYIGAVAGTEVTAYRVRGTTGFVGQSFKSFRDCKIQGTPTMFVGVGDTLSTTVTQSFALWTGRIGSVGDSYPLELEVELTPQPQRSDNPFGAQLMFECANNNQRIDVSASWVELPLIG